MQAHMEQKHDDLEKQYNYNRVGTIKAKSNDLPQYDNYNHQYHDDYAFLNKSFQCYVVILILLKIKIQALEMTKE